MKDWGKWVRWCRQFDHNGDFCRMCLLMNRTWSIVVLRRNPTFVGQSSAGDVDN